MSELLTSVWGKPGERVYFGDYAELPIPVKESREMTPIYAEENEEKTILTVYSVPTASLPTPPVARYISTNEMSITVNEEPKENIALKPPV